MEALIHLKSENGLIFTMGLFIYFIIKCPLPMSLGKGKNDTFTFGMNKSYELNLYYILPVTM